MCGGRSSDTTLVKERGIRLVSGRSQPRNLPVHGKKLVIRRPHKNKKIIQGVGTTNNIISISVLNRSCQYMC